MAGRMAGWMDGRPAHVASTDVIAFLYRRFTLHYSHFK